MKNQKSEIKSKQSRWRLALGLICLIIFNLFLYPAPSFAENQLYKGRILVDGHIYEGQFWERMENNSFNPCLEGMSFEDGVCRVTVITCPLDQALVKGQCQPISMKDTGNQPLCVQGTVVKDGKCKCPVVGEVLVEGKCQRPVDQWDIPRLDEDLIPWGSGGILRLDEDLSL